MRKRYLVVLWVLFVFFSISIVAQAATISDDGWSYQKSGTSTCSNGTISLEATGYKLGFITGSNESSGTLTNNTGVKQVLSGKITFSGSFGSYTITLPDGSKVTGSTAGDYDKNITMDVGQSLTISVKSPSKKETIYCSYTPTVTASNSKTIICNTTSNGTYTINGITPASDNSNPTIVDFDVGDTLTLEATPNSGYVCLGFMLDGTTLLPMDSSKKLDWVPTDGYTITPVFGQISNASAPFKVGDKTYYTWETAVTAAGTNGTVILVGDYALPATYAAQGMTGKGTYVTGTDNNLTYTIPTGTTFLMPYASGQHTVQASNATLPYANYAAQGTDVAADLNPDTELYITLEIPSTCTIQNNGIFVVGGTFASKAVHISGACHGSHSNVELDGKLNMGDNSVLSTVGYILGDGHIEAAGSGAKIYLPLVIVDYGGGGYTVGAAGRINGESYGVTSANFPGGENGAFPFQCYTFLNIQPRITLEYGNTIYSYDDMAASDPIKGDYIHCHTTTTVIGQDTGLISLTGANSKAEIQYLPESFVNTTDYKAIGRTKIDITGNASFGEMTMKVDMKVGGIISIDANTKTSVTTFFVPYNYDITLKNGTFTIPNHLAVLPGSSMTVASDATLNLTGSGTRFIVYDGLNDHKLFGTDTTTYGAAAERKYPTTAQLKAMATSFDDSGKATAYNSGTGNLVVDGTLNIGSGVQFGGTVQTSGAAGANPKIIVDANAVLSCTTQYGVVGSWSIGISGVVEKTWYHVGATVRTLTGQVMDANGNVVPLVTGETYYGVDGTTHKLDSYSYKLYTTSTDTTKYVGVGVAGSDNTVTTDDLAAEVLDATIVGSWCTVQNHNYISKVTTDATCTAEGIRTYTCDACMHSYTEPIPTADHSYDSVVTDPTCTTDGCTTYTCSVCGDSYTDNTIAANGHSYNSVVTDPTCTVDGFTTYTCSVCGDSYTDDKVPATGIHTDADTDYLCDSCGTYLCVLKSIEACYDAEVILCYGIGIPDKLLNTDTAYVRLTKVDGLTDAECITTYSMAELKEAGVDEFGNYIVSAGVASGEMYRKVKVQIFENDDTPLTLYSANYSAYESDPAYNVMHYGATTYSYGNDDQKTMVDALLTYGSYAQKYFGVDTEHPADSILSTYSRSPIDLSVITSDSITQVSSYDANKIGIQIVQTEPNLDSRVFLRLTYKVDAGIDISGYSFELTYREGNEKKTRVMRTEGDSPEVVYDAEKNVCYATIYDIPAAYLDNMYTVKITNTSTGESHSVSTSVICWARQVLIYSSDENQKNLARALYCYNDAAKIFFEIEEIN